MPHLSQLSYAVMSGAIFLWTAVCQAQPPEMPQPTKEHQFLSQFAGEWNATSEMLFAPGEPPLTCEGTESATLLGGFWLVQQGESNVFGTPVKNMLTLGYNPNTKKYIGTSLCSMDSFLWEYEGTADESGKKLTLTTTGPSPLDPSKTTKYREILELKDQNHKTFTTFMHTDEGTWQKIISIDYRRKQ